MVVMCVYILTTDTCEESTTSSEIAEGEEDSQQSK